MGTQHKQSRGTQNLSSCPILSSDNCLPMLTFRLWYRELQLKERSERERGEEHGLTAADAGFKCEATVVRSGQLNREYNTLDYNEGEDIALTE